MGVETGKLNGERIVKAEVVEGRNHGDNPIQKFVAHTENMSYNLDHEVSDEEVLKWVTFLQKFL